MRAFKCIDCEEVQPVTERCAGCGLRLCPLCGYRDGETSRHWCESCWGWLS